MKILLKKQPIIKHIFLLIFLIFSPLFCWAANTKPGCVQTQVFGQVCGIEDLIGKIIDLAVKIVVPLSTLVIIAAGIIYITSTGNPERISRAKNTLILALVSLALVLLAKAIISYLVTTAPIP